MNNLSPEQKEVFKLLFGLVKKSRNVVYMVWAVSGALGGHRLYLGHYKMGFMMMLVTIFTCGLGGIVGLLDVVNITKLTKEYNRERILKTVKVVKML